MLTYILIITAFLFGICYPLFFVGNYEKTVKSGFYRFNLGLACFVAGVGVFGLYFLDMQRSVKTGALVWLLALFLVTAFLWRRDASKRWLLVLPTIFGAVVLYYYLKVHFYDDWSVYLMSALGGFILCSSVFSMNLGHTYLNVKNLPIDYLKKATAIFAALLLVRLSFDVYFLLTHTIEYIGNTISLFSFMQGIDGLFLSMALLFGTVLPIILIILVIETLKIKSTQSATGLLYVIVVSVFIGDIAYKYYLVQYGIVL